MDRTTDQPRRGYVHPLSSVQSQSSRPQTVRVKAENAAQKSQAIHARLVAKPVPVMTRPKTGRVRRVFDSLPGMSPRSMEHMTSPNLKGGPTPCPAGRPDIRPEYRCFDDARMAGPLEAKEYALAFKEQVDREASVIRELPYAPDSDIQAQHALNRLEGLATTSHLRGVSDTSRHHTTLKVGQDIAGAQAEALLEELSQAKQQLELQHRQNFNDPKIKKDLEEVGKLYKEASLVKSETDVARRNATEIHNYFDEATQAMEEAVLTAILCAPPGFKKMNAEHRRLQSAVQRLAGHLPDLSSKDGIPIATWLEMMSLGLAQVTQGDAKRAVAALESLMSRPAAYWIRSPTDPSELSPAEQDVVSLFRLNCNVSRGTELLLLAADHPQASLEMAAPRRQLKDVAEDALNARAYWRADLARKDNKDEKVDDWLRSAQCAAHAIFNLNVDGKVLHSDAEVAALRAVRNGFYSNAKGSPYDLANQRLNKVITEWVDRSTKRTWKQKLLPIHGKTPFSPSAVNALNRAAGDFGIMTPAGQVNCSTREAADHIRGFARGAQEYYLKKSPEDRAPLQQLIVAEAVARFTAMDSDRPLARKLGWGDRKGVLRQFKTIVGELECKLPADPRAQSEFSVLAQKAQEALRSHLKKEPVLVNLLAEVCRDLPKEESLPNADLYEKAQRELLKAQDGLDFAMTSKLRDKKDLVRLIEPQIQSSALRSRTALVSGGSLGPSVKLRLAMGLPIDFDVKAEKYRQNESFLEVFHPLTGVQISAGVRRSKIKDGGGGAGLNFSDPFGVFSSRTALFGRKGKTYTEAEGVILRIRCEEEGLQLMRDNLTQVFKDLVDWRTLKDDVDSEYKDILQALLARHPQLVVGDMKSYTTTNSGEVGVSAAVTAGLPPLLGRSFAIGPQIKLSAKMDNTNQMCVSERGEVRNALENSESTQQKLTFSAGLIAPVGDPHGFVADGDGFDRGGIGTSGVQILGVKIPFDLSVSRDLAQNFAKHSVSHLTHAGEINKEMEDDKDHDRYYDTPEPMIADIKKNWDLWIKRYIDVHPDKPLKDVGLDSDEYRKKLKKYIPEAEEKLNKFCADARALHKTSKRGVYNIHYCMRGDAAKQVEGLRGLADLALKKGNIAEQVRLEGERDTLLRDPSIWGVSAMNLFERGRTTDPRGNGFLFRSMRHNSSENQIQLTEFPARAPHLREPEVAQRGAEADLERGGDEFFDAEDKFDAPEAAPAAQAPPSWSFGNLFGPPNFTLPSLPSLFGYGASPPPPDARPNPGTSPQSSSR